MVTKEYIDEILDKTLKLTDSVVSAENGADATGYADAAFTLAKIYSIFLGVQQTLALNMSNSVKMEKVNGKPNRH